MRIPGFVWITLARAIPARLRYWSLVVEASAARSHPQQLSSDLPFTTVLRSAAKRAGLE